MILWDDWVVSMVREFEPPGPYISREAAAYAPDINQRLPDKPGARCCHCQIAEFTNHCHAPHCPLVKHCVGTTLIASATQ